MWYDFCECLSHGTHKYQVAALSFEKKDNLVVDDINSTLLCQLIFPYSVWLISWTPAWSLVSWQQYFFHVFRSTIISFCSSLSVLLGGRKMKQCRRIFRSHYHKERERKAMMRIGRWKMNAILSESFLWCIWWQWVFTHSLQMAQR